MDSLVHVKYSCGNMVLFVQNCAIAHFQTVNVIIFFLQNSIFHPYLSLQQMELLKSPNVRSFVAGASNYLFKRQKGLSDVLVDVSILV